MTDQEILSLYWGGGLTIKQLAQRVRSIDGGTLKEARARAETAIYNAIKKGASKNA